MKGFLNSCWNQDLNKRPTAAKASAILKREALLTVYGCVYPTRTARFGVALVVGEAPGTLRIKGRMCE